MLKLAYDFARKLGLTDLVLTALPQLYHLYRMGFFEPVGLTFEHTTWGKVHVMRLDLTRLEARRASQDTPMARLLFATDLPNFLL
jgi:hypothetical protein